MPTIEEMFMQAYGPPPQQARDPWASDPIRQQPSLLGMGGMQPGVMGVNYGNQQNWRPSTPQQGTNQSQNAQQNYYQTLLQQMQDRAAGRPVNGMVGSPNLGQAASLSNWASQVPGGMQQLQQMGMAPNIMTTSAGYGGSSFGSNGVAQNSNSFQNDAVGGQNQSLFAQAQNQNRPQAGPQGTQQGQNFSNIFSQMGFNPAQLGLSGGQPQGGGGGGFMPQGGLNRPGIGVKTGGGFAPNQASSDPRQLGMNAANQLVNNPTGFTQQQEGALRTNASDAAAGQQRVNEERIREDAIRRGAASSDADIRDQLGRVGAQGAMDQQKATLGIDQMLAQMRQGGLSAGGGLATGIRGTDVKDNESLRQLAAIMGALGMQQGPQGGLNMIMGL